MKWSEVPEADRERLIKWLGDEAEHEDMRAREAGNEENFVGALADSDAGMIRAMAERLSEPLGGSGFTTSSIMKGLQAHCAHEMAGVLAKTNSSRNKKKENELALGAFEDGMRTMLMHLEKMGVIDIKKE